MGFVMANRGLYVLLTAAITGSSDIRALVCSDAGSPTDAQLEDLNVVADLAGIGLVEVTNTNYARQTLSGLAVAEDDVNNMVVLSASAPTIANVAVGDTWAHVVYYVEGASDAAREIIGTDTPTAELSPTGTTVILPELRVELTDISA